MDTKETGLHAEVCGAPGKIMKSSGGGRSQWAEVYDLHLKPVMKQPAPGEPKLTKC